MDINSYRWGHYHNVSLARLTHLILYGTRTASLLLMIAWSETDNFPVS